MYDYGFMGSIGIGIERFEWVLISKIVHEEFTCRFELYRFNVLTVML